MASALSKPKKQTVFASLLGPNLQKIGKKQVLQTLWTSLAVSSYAEKGLRVREFLHTLFHTVQSSVVFIHVRQVLQILLSTAGRDSIATLYIITPSVSEVHIFFCSVAMVENTIQVKTLKSSSSYRTVTLLGYTVQKTSKA